MGIPTSIKTLLEGNVVEWARIEFKKSWMPEESLKTICAFANDIDNWGGGYVILGVEEEKGRPVLPAAGLPIEKVDDILKDILNKCHQITPAYLPVAAPVEYQGRMLIVIWAPGGDVRPYSSPADFYYENHKAKPKGERVYFIRKMSSTVKPSPDELSELYSLSNKVPFDDRVNHEAELSNLNVNLIRQYLQSVDSRMAKDLDNRPMTEICEDMAICNNMPEYRKPRNVGLMFFADEPDRFFPYAQIDVVAFPQGLGGDVIDEQTFKGPLDQQLRDALRYIRNSYIKRKIIKHPDRAEADHIYNYPYAAIEEALANAVYHKAYDEREPIEVRIDDEKIEILSFPGPVRSVTREQLKSYKVTNRRYRNRRIGEFLKELHLTEGRNTGFKKILDAVRANGSPLPEFETDDEHTFFITRIYVHKMFRRTEEAERPGIGTDHSPMEAGNPEKGVKDSGSEAVDFKNEVEEPGNEAVNSENGVKEPENEVVNPGKDVDDPENRVVNFGKDEGDSGNEAKNTMAAGLSEAVREKLAAFGNVKRQRAEKIIVGMQKDECVTIPQLAILTGLAKSTLDRYISELKEHEVIAREGSPKGGRWTVL